MESQSKVVQEQRDKDAAVLLEESQKQLANQKRDLDANQFSSVYIYIYIYIRQCLFCARQLFFLRRGYHGTFRGIYALKNIDSGKKADFQKWFPFGWDPGSLISIKYTYLRSKQKHQTKEEVMLDGKS